MGPVDPIYSAAGFKQMVKAAYEVKMNLSDTETSPSFDQRRFRSATQESPKLIEDILKT